MGYKWLDITQDFDRTLSFTKVRFNLADSNRWSDGFFAECANKNCDGQGWSSVNNEEWCYAGTNRFNLNYEYYSCRAENFTNRSITTYCTLISGSTYEYTYPVPLYWGGLTLPKMYNYPGQISVYARTITFETDVDTISASSAASSYTISLSADTELTWTASTEDGWLSVSPSTGSGDGQLVVSVLSVNYKHSVRTGTITITDNEGDVITISVNQAGVPNTLLNRNMYRSGNKINKAYRSGEIIFQRVGLTCEDRGLCDDGEGNCVECSEEE